MLTESNIHLNQLMNIGLVAHSETMAGYWKRVLCDMLMMMSNGLASRTCRISEVISTNRSYYYLWFAYEIKMELSCKILCYLFVLQVSYSLISNTIEDMRLKYWNNRPRKEKGLKILFRIHILVVQDKNSFFIIM